MQRAWQVLCVLGAGPAAAQTQVVVETGTLGAPVDPMSGVQGAASGDGPLIPVPDLPPLPQVQQESTMLDAAKQDCTDGSCAQPPSVLSLGASLPAVRPKGLLTVSGMKVASTKPEGSLIHFGPAAEYAMGTDAGGNFVVLKNGMPPVLSLNTANHLKLAAHKVDMQQLEVSGDVLLKGVRQWAMVAVEDFSSVGDGWSRPEVTHCGGVSMLGGFCKLGAGEVNKTFAGLPPHKQLRVVAQYHFIDRWIGESGYMKLNIGKGGSLVPVWTEQHAQQESKNGLSLCGQAGTPEGKFSVSIDVTIPHVTDSVMVTFGSTMDDSDPCDESWGVSGVEVYVRS